MGDDYAVRQARRDAEHERAYADWLATLNPSQRRMLAAADDVSPGARLDTAAVERSRRGPVMPEPSHRPEETLRMSHTPDMAGRVDTLAETYAERYGISEDLAARIAADHVEAVEAEAMTYKAFLFQRLIGAFIAPGNVKLRAGALAFAANLAALNGLGTQTEYAARLRVRRQSLSKVVVWWRKELNLPPSPHCKSDEARRKFSEAQKQKHWRKKKCRAHT